MAQMTNQLIFELKNVLNSIEYYVKGIHSVHVVYHASSKCYKDGYEKIIEEHYYHQKKKLETITINFIDEHNNNIAIGFKNIVSYELLFGASSIYIAEK